MAAKETDGRSLLSVFDLKKPGVRVLYWIMVIGLCLGALTTILPLVWGMLSALKLSGEIFAFPPRFFPEGRLFEWQWRNYAEAWNMIDFPRYFRNTMILAFGVWFFQIIPSAFAGYAISKFSSKMVRVFAFLFFLTLMVPFEAIMIPLYLTVKNVPGLGVNLLQRQWGGGYLAIILPAGVNAFNIFVFKGFFDQIPNDLMEAARIDGAGEIRTFFTIVLPLSRSIIAVLSIFSIMFTWNDFFWPLIVVHDQRFYTIMLKLYIFSTQSAVSVNISLAALMIATIPPIILFLIFQKQIMKGITLSGLKY
ncbi:MAG TPA: carbohydrate ABC transporter permease [Candidatus Sumerlaeota bacterium]|nr:carbohydrate ABC transporter permease [Candidatus Sumerlaeota bacterium]